MHINKIMKKKSPENIIPRSLGSYSHQASTKFFKDPLVVPCDSFEEAIETVRKGKADKAILPVDNSTYGRVADSLSSASFKAFYNCRILFTCRYLHARY